MGTKGQMLLLSGVLTFALVVFYAGNVLAAGPTSCIVGNNDFTISIDASGGQFPIVINDNTSDVNNYCGNGSMENYPCTVYLYKVIAGQQTIGYQKATITLPICPDAPLQILLGGAAGAPHDIYSPCDTDQTQPHHWYDSVCGSRAAYYTSLGGGGGVRSFYLAVKGRNAGVGVISAFLSDQDVFYRCVNKDANNLVQGGILGPGCTGTICERSDTKVKTLCTSVEGSNYRIDLDNGIPTKIWNCGGDAQCVNGCTEITSTFVPASDACLVFEGSNHCWSLTEIGSANGDTNTQTGYASFADSPGYVLMYIGGKLTLVYKP